MFSPNRLTLRQLELMVAIAEHKSLAGAARHLHLTPSALSHRLRLLESSLGRPVVERGVSPFRFTKAGLTVLAAGRDIRDVLRAATRHLEPDSAVERFTLVVATECYTCYQWLPACVRELRVTSPAMDVRLNVAATRDPVKALQSRSIDLAMVTSPLADARLEGRKLMKDEMLAIVPRQHPWTQRSYIGAEDFLDVDLLTMAVPLHDTILHRRVLAPARVKPRRVSRLPLVEAIIEMVREDMGVAVLPRWVLGPALRDQRIAGVRITRAGVWRQWRAYFLPTATRTTAAHAFCRAVQAWAGQVGSD